MVSSMLGVVLAAMGGSLSATGANVLAWSAHKTRSEGKVWSAAQSALFVIASFVLTVAGISLFALSCALGGAVATVMPIQTGANLLVNMCWQIGLGIKRFNKNMRAGTFILVCAVAELTQIGPQEPEHIDVLRLIAAPSALLWNSFLVIASLVTLAGSLATVRRRSYDGSLVQLVFVTLCVSLFTVTGSNISKMFGLVTGAELVAAGVSYFFVGVGCMAMSLIANAVCDVSIYIPAQLSSQLVLNMITGYCLWEDAKYISAPGPYILVYLICVMAVYLISPELDVVAQVVRSYQIRNSMLSTRRAQSRLGTAVLRLLEAWERHQGQILIEDPEEREACASSLRNALREGTEGGVISAEELVELVMSALGDQVGPSAAVVHWIEHHSSHFQEYAKHDPDFQDHFRQTLSPAEFAKLLRSCDSPVSLNTVNGNMSELGASNSALLGQP